MNIDPAALVQRVLASLPTAAFLLTAILVVLCHVTLKKYSILKKNEGLCPRDSLTLFFTGLGAFILAFAVIAYYIPWQWLAFYKMNVSIPGTVKMLFLLLKIRGNPYFGPPLLILAFITALSVTAASIAMGSNLRFQNLLIKCITAINALIALMILFALFSEFHCFMTIKSISLPH